MNLTNMPELKLGIVAVSRDCFPMSLSENRRKAVVASYKGRSTNVQLLWRVKLTCRKL